MNENLESVALARERIARSLHRRKPMWRKKPNLLRWVLLAILMGSVLAMNLAHGAQTIWVAPVFSTATYVWTDTPCGTTSTKTIATTTIAQLDVTLAPGCHVIQATAKSATAVWNVYPPIQLTIASQTPKAPTKFGIH